MAYVIDTSTVVFIPLPLIFVLLQLLSKIDQLSINWLLSKIDW